MCGAQRGKFGVCLCKHLRVIFWRDSFAFLSQSYSEYSLSEMKGRKKKSQLVIRPSNVSILCNAHLHYLNRQGFEMPPRQQCHMGGLCLGNLWYQRGYWETILHYLKPHLDQAEEAELRKSAVRGVTSRHTIAFQTAFPMVTVLFTSLHFKSLYWIRNKALWHTGHTTMRGCVAIISFQLKWLIDIVEYLKVSFDWKNLQRWLGLEAHKQRNSHLCSMKII